MSRATMTFFICAIIHQNTGQRDCSLLRGFSSSIYLTMTDWHEAIHNMEEDWYGFDCLLKQLETNNIMDTV